MKRLVIATLLLSAAVLPAKADTWRVAATIVMFSDVCGIPLGPVTLKTFQELMQHPDPTLNHSFEDVTAEYEREGNVTWCAKLKDVMAK
jgi:hypothetical protein